MATHLDLDEQEQLDQLKAFWKRYGNLVVWTLALAMAIFGGLNYWKSHQRDEAAKASALYDELEKNTQAGEVEKSMRVFSDLKERFASTAYAQQAGLLLSKLQQEKGQADPAITSLSWVADHAIEAEYKTMARFRLAGVLLDQKKYDDALKQLSQADTKEFAALVADRRGDVLLAQGKTEDAKAAYQLAWKALDATVEYRSFIEAKLGALGVTMAADAVAIQASAGMVK
jgi:predicted negative regulator of RcsB-dependent stress response